MSSSGKKRRSRFSDDDGVPANDDGDDTAAQPSALKRRHRADTDATSAASPATAAVPEAKPAPAASTNLASIIANIAAQKEQLKAALAQTKAAAAAVGASTPATTAGSGAPEALGSALPPPLLLDEQGREVDADGNLLATTTDTAEPTLLINRRGKGKGKGKGKKGQASAGSGVANDDQAGAAAADQGAPAPPELYRNEPRLAAQAAAYDPNLPIANPTRGRRSFKWVQPGTHMRRADRVRARAARAEVEAAAASATHKPDGTGSGLDPRLARLQEHFLSVLGGAGPAPVEWWDAALCGSRVPSYAEAFALVRADVVHRQKQLAAARKDPEAGKGDATASSAMEEGDDEAAPSKGKGKDDAGEGKEEEEGEDGAATTTKKKAITGGLLTNLVERPAPLERPGGKPKPEPLPMVLTKAERKKMRRQKRRAEQEEKRKAILLGLAEPEPDKVRLSTMMKQRGMEAIENPTKLEDEVRRQMAERYAQHHEQNQARKLSAAERRAKRREKLTSDAEAEVRVAVFRLTRLDHTKLHFKVVMNAKQHMLTGVAVVHPDLSVVVVEGGPKSIRFYVDLMLRRIDWNWRDDEAQGGGDEDASSSDDDDDDEAKNHKAGLVWEGSVAHRSFHGFNLVELDSVANGRDVFAKRGVAQYFDLARDFNMNQ